MSGPFGSSQWMYSSGGGFYDHTIDYSVKSRINSRYLSRTPSSTGNRKAWTWSGWVKRGRLSTSQQLFSAGGSVSDQIFFQNNTDKLKVYLGTDVLTTTAIFRDTAAWYHIVVSVNTADGTASNRVRLYVNGSQVTAFDQTSYPSQNYDTKVNTTTAHYMGRYAASASEYLDAYLAEINFTDGYAQQPTDFGEFKSGVWIPKKYSGNYGTNGFYLKFANSSSFGTDSSGNSNNWTPTGYIAADQMLDSPTNNFAVINANELNTTINEVSLRVEGQADACPTFHIPPTGKWYAEFLPTNIGNNTHFGFTRSDKSALTHSEIDSFRMVIPQGGSLYLDGTGLSSPQSANGYSSGDVLSLAIDMDNGHAYWRANNTVIGSLTNQAVIRNNRWKFLTYMNASNDKFNHNYGQDSSFGNYKTPQGNTDENGQGDFYYTPPSGYLALCSANLPVAEAVDPAEDNSPQDYFNAVTWTGNGGTLSITSVDWKPDFVWLKRRNSANQHNLHDIVRGPTKVLHSNSSEAEETITNGLTSFNSTGFSLGNDGGWNASGQPYIAWNWKGSNTTVSNTSGSITSTVSVNPDAGISVLTYTGNGTSGATVGHGLGKVPAFYWVRWRNNTSNYHVYHKSTGATKGFILNETNAVATNSGFWNNTAPTSSVFSLGYYGGSNSNGGLFSAVCFAEIEGFSAFGQYKGNGSTNGPFVYTGHRPAFVLMKHINGSNNWLIYDDERLGYNQLNNFLYPNQSQQEDVAIDFPRINILSNGFKLINNYGDINGSGSEYLYATFAHNPFKYALAR